MDEPTEKTLKEILSEAKQAEADGDTETALGLYDGAINNNPLDEFAYNRQMLLFRKQKQYKKELAVIKRAIKTFEDLYKSKIPKKSKAITEISNKLNRSVGLADKKGNFLYSPEPIAKWKKRKIVVEKKLDKK